MTDRGAGVRAALAGSGAARCLAALARRPGTVLAVFERSFYLCAADGALACLGPPSIGAGPLNALLPGRPGAGIRPGGRTAPEGGGFRLPGGPVVAARPEALYRPDCRASPPSRRMAGLLVRRARAFAPADGLAPLVARAPAPLPPVAARAAGAAARLAAWLRGGAAAAPPPGAVAQLVGLGPGLTPSGDDFLGGMMIALAASGRRGAARRLAGTALPRARTATNRISRAHLAAAARGQGAAALHDALAALAGEDEGELDAALEAVCALGHCSGWDALAGAVAALAARPDTSAAAASAASALEAATTTPASRSRAT